MDLWLKDDRGNQDRLIKALKENNVVGTEILKNTQFVFEFTSIRFDKSNFELDLGHQLKAFQGQDFDTCYNRAYNGNIEGTPLKVININDLLK